MGNVSVWGSRTSNDFHLLETLSISSPPADELHQADPAPNEAALKYLLIGAASTAIFLYGFPAVRTIERQAQLSAIATVNADADNL